MHDPRRPLRTIAAVEAAVRGRVAGFDPAAWRPAELTELARGLGTVARLVEAVYALAVRELERGGAHRCSSAANAVEHIARVTGREARSVRRALAAGRVLEEQPTLQEAVRHGGLSVEQAAKIGPVAALVPESTASLLSAAAAGDAALRDAIVAARAERETADERRTRQWVARSLAIWPDADGMIHGRFALPPEEGGLVKAALDKATDRCFRATRGLQRAQAAADALVALVTEGGGAAPVVNVAVVVDYDVLARGADMPGERCVIPGVGPVSAAWVREQYGDCFLKLVVARGHDVTTVAHLGRAPNAVQRTALLVQGRECMIDGCRKRGYLKLDHEQEWARGGPTTLDNLGWLCRPHHVRKTQGWRLGPTDPATGKRELRAPAEPP